MPRERNGFEIEEAEEDDGVAEGEDGGEGGHG